MRFAKVLLIPAGLALLCWSASAPGPASADGVLLKNGRRVEGKVIDNRQTTGNVVVEIGTAGRMTFRGSQVEKIEAGEVKEAASREYVSVTMSKEADYYGGKTFDGAVSAESDDRTLVLDLPGGKVRIPKAGIAKTVKAEAPAAPRATANPEEARTIQTTHRVELVNGRKLQGNLLSTPESEPVKLQVNGLGVLTIPRKSIAPDGIKEAAGSITIPAQPKEAPPPAVKEPTPEEQRAQMKRELRDEILREILDQLIDEKVSAATHGSGLKAFGLEDQRDLTNDEVLAIQDAVRELGRQRSQNRVRAENRLKEMGSAALPYLEPIASHPFELTRRAVQRIVRDVGSLRGAPIAIEALNDPDGFVRELAHEALEKILPSQIAYGPNASERVRLAAQEGYRVLWDEVVRASTREEILKKLAVDR